MDATTRFDTQIVGALPVITNYLERLKLADHVNDLVHTAIRIISRGLFRSSNIADASNPLCIMQFLQSRSSRDSQ